MNHAKDSDCTVDAKTMMCIECGVHHGEQCLDCDGCGFHESWCPSMIVSHSVTMLDDSCAGLN